MNHQEIIELLPWYVTATLDEDEHKTVEAHVAECRECAREVESLATMQKAVVAVGDETPGPSPFLLNRALAEIEDYERSRARESKRVDEQKKRFWEGWWPATPVFARAALAVQLAAVVVLGAVTVYQHQHPQVISTTASGPSAPGNAARIVVGFSDGATEQQIRQTVLGIQGRIVDGPSALGLYTIEVNVPRDKPVELDPLLQKLRQDHSVVRFAAEKQ